MAVSHILVTGLLLLGCIFAAGWDELCLGTCATLAAAISVLMAASVLGICTRAIVEQKNDGTLAILLTTSLSESRLVLAYVLACVTMILPSLVAAHVLILLQRFSFPSEPPRVLEAIAAAGFSLICVTVGVVLFSLLGLLASTICKSVGAAGLATFVMLLAGGCCLMSAVSSMFADGEGGSAYAGTFGLLLLVGLAVVVLFFCLTHMLRTWHHRV